MLDTIRTYKLYFLIVNYNSSQLIERLINSLALKPEDKAQYQITIVNNSPKDKEICCLKNESIKIIEAGSNLGFGRACNLGLDWIYSQDKRAIAWLINPDTYFNLDAEDIEAHPVDIAIALFQKYPQISLLGTTVYDSQGKLTSAGGLFTPGTAALKTIDSLPENSAEYWQTDWTSGCSLSIDLAKFASCPKFDPRYFMYYEDLDFCLRYNQQGHQIAVTPLIKVFHDTSTISDRNLFAKYQYVTRSYLIHIEKHGSRNTFIRTNLRMMANTVRLILFRPQQGWGKLIGIYQYWQTRFTERSPTSY